MALRDKMVCDTLPTLFPRAAVGDMWQQRALLKRDQRAPNYPTSRQLLNKLYDGANPYHGLGRREMAWADKIFPSSAVKAREAIWRAVHERLGNSSIRLLLEVGSFIGTSAVHTWGPLAHKTQALLLCIDTWQGDVNMRLQHKKFSSLTRLRHGIPTTSAIFLDNIVAHNLTQSVFPLAMGSLTAARLLATVNWKVDVAYIDSAHEVGETLVELHMYYNLLRPGGLLLGDDYTFFPAVRHDVRIFAGCHNLEVQRLPDRNGNVWLLQKPLDEASSLDVTKPDEVKGATRDASSTRPKLRSRSSARPPRRDTK